MAVAGSDKWTIAIVGGEVEFGCTAGQSLLAAMIAARHSAIKVGCRSGGCGVCRVRVIMGRYQSQKMTRSRISEADEAEGIVLACRILPQSNVTFEPLPITTSGAMA
jgi:ferredoxin